MLNYFVVIMCSDLGTVRKLLGKVCIDVKGSIDLYYPKYRIRTWTRKTHKVTITLVIEVVLSVSVTTCVTVMNRKVVLVQDLGGHKELSPNNINMHKSVDWFREKCLV